MLNTLDLWTQWNIPNRERQIPALKNVSTEAYKFLDLQPRSIGERNRLTRLQSTRTGERRASRKVASDMKTVCEFIEKEAAQFGYIDITEENMVEAFREVTETWERAGGLVTNGGRRVRFEQRSWKTTLTFVRQLKKERMIAASTSEANNNNNDVADSSSESDGTVVNTMRGSTRRHRSETSRASRSSGESSNAGSSRRPRRRQRTQVATLQHHEHNSGGTASISIQALEENSRAVDDKLEYGLL